MIPPDIAHHLTIATRVLVTGPRLTAADLSSLAAIAARIRHATPVLMVTTPLDCARAAGTRLWDSTAYARAKSEVLAVTDAVILAPRWEGDAHALTTVEIADALGLTIVEWDYAVPIAAVEALHISAAS